MARRSEVRDVPVVDEYGELLVNFASDPATTVASRRAINWRRGEYGHYDEVLTEFQTIAGRIGECSKITDVLFYDASLGRYYDLLAASSPEKAMLFHGEDDLATGQFTLGEATDALLVATMRHIGGFEFVIDASILNNNASTMTYEYSSASGFTSTAVTDGTKSTGTFEQDGIVEITAVPADGAWQPKQLHEIQGIGHPEEAKKLATGTPRYWSRFSSDNLTDAIEIEQIRTLLISVADTTGSAPAGNYKLTTEYVKDVDQLEVGSLEIWCQSGSTGDLSLTWYKYS